MKQFTRIDLGLTIAHRLLFTKAYGGARAGVKKLAFILTDGKQNPDKDGVAVSVAVAAKPLIDANIKTISIGIGKDVNKHELRAMVEFDEDVTLTANFEEYVLRVRPTMDSPYLTSRENSLARNDRAIQYKCSLV